MLLTDEDVAVIKACCEEKHWRGAEICWQFKGEGWSDLTVKKALKRLKETGNIYRKNGSGWPTVWQL